MSRKKTNYQTKSVWHTLSGEYDLSDNELVLVVFQTGYMLARYDKEEDAWRNEADGKLYCGGWAMMPLPEPVEARQAALDLIKDEPWAPLA